MLVLCLDDDASVLAALRAVLDRHTQVEVFTKVDLLLASVRNRHPDAVISDFDVGESRTGVWVLEQVARLEPSARRILLTGSSIDNVSEIASEHVQTILRKPVGSAELLQALGIAP